MSKSLLLVLLLAVGTLSYNNGYGWDHYNCPGCKPAPVKTDRCNQPMCYRCGPNQQFNINTLYCDCKAGYVPINGYCGKCPEGYIYDFVMHQCIGQDPCGINQHIVNGVCKCLPGLTVIQNICQRCPTNQAYFPQYDACRCLIGYTLVKGVCVYIPCVDNEVYDAEQQACVCAQGYFRVVTVTSTTDPATNITTNVTTSVCIQCAFNQIYNAVTKTCDPFIPPECGRNEYFYEHCCFCEIGYVRIGGVCIKCPDHSSYDWNTDSCICNPGYYFVGEQVKQIPYQYHDTGSSFTSNPSRHYSYKAPSTGVPAQEPIIIIGSNYDYSGINRNGANHNMYNPPPINS